MIVLTEIWNAIADMINSVLSVVFSFLPPSPFKDMLDSMSDIEVLQYLNWIVPVGDFLEIMIVWLAAIIVFYAYQVILRWLKAVAD